MTNTEEDEEDQQQGSAAAAAVGNSTNPFEMAQEEEEEQQQPQQSNDGDDDDDNQSVHSAASMALREDFIRLTTTEQQADVEAAAAEDASSSADQHANANARANKSLARASTSPRICWVFLPVMCLVCHALFAIGQTIPMWRLSLTAEDISVWANATTETSRWAYKALNLPAEAHYEMHQNKTVQSFTYGFAVQELWAAKGMPGTTVPRIAAALLVLFSGFWPHMKLVLLQYSWWSTSFSRAPHRRTRALSWLALLGKWSLADVLVVCVMVGVLNLEWDIDPLAIKQGAMDHLQTLLQIAQLLWTTSQICTKFMHFDTSDCGSNSLSILERLKCRGCKTFVDETFYRPDAAQKTANQVIDGISPSGGGQVRLSVVGMNGIYFFCAAVCLSVILSVMVEWYNHKFVATLRKEQRRRGRRGGGGGAHTLSLTSTDEDAPGMSATVSDLDSSDISEPLLGSSHHQHDGNDDLGFEPMELMDDEQSVFSYMVQRTTSSPVYKFAQCHHIVPMVTLAFVALALYLPSMERSVGGAIPKLMKEILGVHLDKTYSIQSLKDTCGKAGGWDLFLMATFALFMIIAPLTRAVLVVVAAMSKSSGANTQRIRSLLVATANFLAAFCAWEVFLLGLFMVQLIMPSATSSILDRPACRTLSGDGTSCLVVNFDHVPSTFACLVIGFCLVGGLAVHVSMEDEKERHMLENHDDRIAAARPTTEVNASGQYYVEVANGDNEEEVADDPRTGLTEDGAVGTMIEQEVV